MVAALTRAFGIHNLALAEDVVQDAFCRALEIWKFRGVPENPSAWLMKTAKNRALDVLRRERTARTFAPDLGRLLQTEWTLAPAVEEILDPTGIADDQLRMMFSCCHPRLPEAAQVDARAAVGRWIRRARGGRRLRDDARRGGEAVSAIEETLGGVGRSLRHRRRRRFRRPVARGAARALPHLQRRLSRRVRALRRARRVCREAIRLTQILAEHPLGAQPSTFALCALMHLDAARLPARLDASGNLSSLFDQDRARWDRTAIAHGRAWLERSATGSEVSRYHVEAAIASIHADAQRFEETDWAAIVALYDRLMAIAPSPIVALNRAIAIAQVDGPQPGLRAIDAIADADRLSSTRSIMPPAANSNCAGTTARSPASTSNRHSRTRATRASAASWSGASPHAPLRRMPFEGLTAPVGSCVGLQPNGC